jgi:threonine/homoserine efflux transporter RhtA
LRLGAAGLLFHRQGVGAALAFVAALLWAGWGVRLSFCLCSPAPPLSTPSIALLVAALAVFPLALVDLLTLGLAWVLLVLAFGVPFPVLEQPPHPRRRLVVAAVVAWLLLRRRGSGRSTD